MHRQRNQGTQPCPEMPVFNNWDVIPEGWYIAIPSQALTPGSVQSLALCGQHVALYRGEDGKVRALDGFCPHLGADLGLGTVEGDQLVCWFHKWRFDEAGTCTHIPCSEKIPDQAQLKSYPTDERYGFIWVYAGFDPPPGGVPGHEELEGEEVVWAHGRAYTRTCHHHVTMLNGLDPQHLRTVHDFQVDVECAMVEDEARGLLDFSLTSELPADTPTERLAQWLLGTKATYKMRFAQGCNGFLTVLKDTTWFGGNHPFPELYMVFAHRPDARGKVFIQPIYLARRSPGALGWLRSRFLTRGMQFVSDYLQADEGGVYEKMRFRPGAMLPIDAPMGQFIRWVNKLKPSPWTPPKVEV